MTNDDVKTLCLALMRADTEEQVIASLTKAGLVGCCLCMALLRRL